MSLNIDRQLRQIKRFGTLARYIDSHLDDTLTLAQLAEVACVSRHRLDGGFHAYAHETPMSRVWRLRLQRARQAIMAQPKRSLLDVACEAGYASTQAFSRAFSRLHGQAPSLFRRHVPVTQAALRVELLPEMAIQYIPYTGSRTDQQQAANELRARAMACGIERERRFGWAVNVEANLYASGTQRIDTEAALLHVPLAQRIPGLDEGRIRGGAYAVFRFGSGVELPAAPLLMARIEEETGWRAVEGPWLRRCRNMQHLPSFLDRCFEVYIPVQPSGCSRSIQPQAFVLER
ncbi:MAG TPA: AraC family transcriptional regulator [Rhodocyclaceae bacterium]|nr:AraC family transcriptional regulator [Rhodocyclaceae bacterium]